MATKNFDVARSKIFNFYSIRFVIITKSKPKCSQKIEICKYKIDTGCDSNLMPYRMHRILCLCINYKEINKCMHKEIVFWTHNYLCNPQIGICRLTLIDKDIEYQYSFFVVPGNGPALLGMPDCEGLQLLSINC